MAKERMYQTIARLKAEKEQLQFIATRTLAVLEQMKQQEIDEENRLELDSEEEDQKEDIY